MQRNKRLKKVAAFLKQCRRRAAVVDKLGEVGLICSCWIPSRWITHVGNNTWDTTVIPFFTKQRDWLDEQSRQVLQITTESIPDVVKSKSLVTSLSDVDRNLLLISNPKPIA